MSCPICSSQMQHCFEAQVLGKYQAEFKVCNECGYLKAVNPHWLEEAYARAIASADTGLVMRNITLTNKISRVLYWLTPERGQGCYLDIAGGYGMLTRMMRDVGFNFYWSDKYCQNLIAPGFEYHESKGQCAAVTAIEVMEHVLDPFSFIKEALRTSGALTFIFTTELYEESPPNPDDWWYYAFATGQHIGFFQHRTLEKLASNLNMRLTSANGLHIFSENKINKFMLSLLTNRYFSLFPTPFIRRVVGSKMLSDHNMMMQKIVNMENN